MAISLTELNSLPTRADLLELLQAIKTVKQENAELKHMLTHLTKRFTEFVDGRAERRKQLYYSPGQFAKLIGRSRSWVTAGVHSGDVVGTQPGGEGTAWLIPASELTRWEEELNEDM